MSWLDERLLDSEDSICSMQLVAVFHVDGETISLICGHKRALFMYLFD
jgi:hypothetical protein